jgi:hypothetical protein
MELKPSQEALDQIAQAKRDAKKEKRVQSAAERTQRERRTQIDRLNGFTRKMYKVTPDWVAIRTDDETGSVLQAKVVRWHQPRDYSDIDWQRDEETHYSLVARFVDAKHSEDSSEEINVARIFITESYQTLHIYEAFGLVGGSVDLKAQKDIEPKVVDQALEIEQEILDHLA